MDYFLKHGRNLEKKYAGKYIAVIDNKVVAVGSNRLEVYQKATKSIPSNRNLGIFYLPLKNNPINFQMCCL